MTTEQSHHFSLGRIAGSMRFRYFSAFGLAAIALWVMIAFALDVEQREAIARADLDGRNLARSLAEHEMASIRAVDGALMELGDEWTEGAAAFSAGAARQRAMLVDEPVAQIAVTDANGRVVYSDDPARLGSDLSNRPYFKAGKEGNDGKLYISVPVLGGLSKKWVNVFARATYDDKQRFAGVIFVSIPSPNLERVYKDIELGTGAFIALVRSDGRILAHSDDAYRSDNRSLAGSPALRPNGPDSGNYRIDAGDSSGGQIHAFHKVSHYPLTVIVGQSTGTVLAPYYAERTRYLAFGALSTVILLAFPPLLISRRSERDSQDRSRAQLAAIVQGSSDAIVSANLNNEIETWNAGAEKLYGYSAGEVIGRHSTDLYIPPERHEEFLGVRDMIDRGESPSPADAVHVTKDGRRIDVSITRFPIMDECGKTIGRSEIIHDVTERRRQEKRLRLEHAITNCIASAEDVASGLKTIMRTICHAEDWQRGGYWQVDAAAGVLRIGSFWNTPGNALDAYAEQSQKSVFAPGKGVIGQVWQTQQPLWIRDATADPRVVNADLARQTGLHSVFAFPVVDAEAVMGVLAFQSHSVREPDERLLAATRMIGSQVGQFLQRKKAEEELQQTRDQFRRLVEDSPLSMALVTSDGAIEYLNRKAIETFGYLPLDIPSMDRWWLLAYPDEAYRAEVIEQWMRLVGEARAHNREIEQRDYRVACKDGSTKIVAIFGTWVASKVLVIFEDVTERRHAERELALALDRFRFLAESARVYAWIRHFDGRPSSYLTPPDALLGPRLEAGNYPFLRELLHPDDLPAYDAITANAIAELSEYEREVRITRIDGEVRWLMVRGKAYREPDANTPSLAGVTVDITERKFAEEQIHQINQHLERRVRERTVDLSRTIDSLQAEVEHRRQAEAEALALADRVQIMARRLGDAQEIERRRLAADVHDGVCSNLAAIGLNLELLRRQLDRNDTAGMGSRLTDLIAHVDYAQATAKNIAVDLRPLLHNDRALLAALKDYAEIYERSTGLAVKIEGAESGRNLPANHKVALFRIAQEALTNCAKHAKAKSVSVALNFDANHAELIISDDGIGFDVANVNAGSRGLGLLSMQERTEAIGGIWHIESTPGNGTRVAVRVEAAASV